MEGQGSVNLADLCLKLIDGVVHVEVTNPVLRQVYQQFRPHIARTIEERVPKPCQDWER